MSKQEAIVAVDIMRGDLLVHFGDGESVLFRAEFLRRVRHEHGNRVLSDEIEEEETDGGD